MMKLLIFVLPLSLASAVTYVIAAADYTCGDKSETQITYNKYDLSCAEGKVCNKYHIVGLQPCTDKSLNCFNQFQCSPLDEKLVTIDAIKFRCNGEFICNKGFKDPCDPCIPPPCADQYWECNPDDPTNVTIPNLGTIPCDSGTVCNQNNEYPCAPCIKKDNTFEFGIQLDYSGFN